MDDDDPNETYSGAPIFKGKHYAYFKENIFVHLMSLEKMLWVAITDEPFISRNEINNYIKLSKDQSGDETKNASYDLTERNIFIFALSAKLYYSILKLHVLSTLNVMVLLFVS